LVLTCGVSVSYLGPHWIRIQFAPGSESRRGKLSQHEEKKKSKELKNEKNHFFVFKKNIVGNELCTEMFNVKKIDVKISFRISVEKHLSFFARILIQIRIDSLTRFCGTYVFGVIRQK
jgi:hypothetical protein